MRETGAGTLLYTTGAGSIWPDPRVANVNAAAAALHNWAMNLHKEQDGTGIQAAHVGIDSPIGVSVIPGVEAPSPSGSPPLLGTAHHQARRGRARLPPRCRGLPTRLTPRRLRPSPNPDRVAAPQRRDATLNPAARGRPVHQASAAYRGRAGRLRRMRSSSPTRYACAKILVACGLATRQPSTCALRPPRPGRRPDPSDHSAPFAPAQTGRPAPRGFSYSARC